MALRRMGPRAPVLPLVALVLSSVRFAQSDALTKAALPAFVAAVRAALARGVPARALHAFDAADLAASGAAITLP